LPTLASSFWAQAAIWNMASVGLVAARSGDPGELLLGPGCCYLEHGGSGDPGELRKGPVLLLLLPITKWQPFTATNSASDLSGGTSLPFDTPRYRPASQVTSCTQRYIGTDQSIRTGNMAQR
jgi:hypothetical protein